MSEQDFEQPKYTGKGKSKRRHHPELYEDEEPPAKRFSVGFSAEQADDEELKVGASVLPPLYKKDVSALSSDLDALELHSMCMTDCEAINVFKTLKDSGVRTLNMSNNWICDDAILVLAEVLPDTKVRHLDLEQNCLTISGLIALFSSLAESQVEHLRIGGNPGLCADDSNEMLLNILPDKGAAFDIKFECDTVADELDLNKIY